MTAVDAHPTPAGCPVTHLDEVSFPSAPGGTHFATFDAKREEGVVHTGHAGEHEFFMVTRMAEVRASFQNHRVFSNSAVTPSEPDPPYLWIPEMLDGQIHTAWRQLTGPLFSPATVAAMEPKLRQRFGEILDEVAGRGECEFIHEVGLLFPNVIFMDIMGLPREDARTFQRWEVEILHGGRADEATGKRRLDAMMAVMGYFSDLIAKRRADPRDDLLSTALTWTIDGEPIPDSDLLAFCLLMFMAGLDTVAAQLGFNFWHLATHDDDRRRIVGEPELMAPAIEELLRYYSFVTPSRKVMSDTDVAGCPIPAGRMVFMPLVAANRDPREFPDADRVVIDREVNRHIAFGAGPHRCLGSHLARLELRVAMEMWHERIPDYRLAEGAVVMEHGGQIGLDHLPLVWDV